MGEVHPNLRCHGNMMRYQLVEVHDFWQMNTSLDYDLSCILLTIIGPNRCLILFFHFFKSYDMWHIGVYQNYIYSIN